MTTFKTCNHGSQQNNLKSKYACHPGCHQKNLNITLIVNIYCPVWPYPGSDNHAPDWLSAHELDNVGNHRVLLAVEGDPLNDQQIEVVPLLEIPIIVGD